MDRLNSFHQHLLKADPKTLALSSSLQLQLPEEVLAHGIKQVQFQSESGYRESWTAVFYKQAQAQIKKGMESISFQEEGQLLSLQNNFPFKLLTLIRPCQKIQFSHHDLVVMQPIHENPSSIYFLAVIELLDSMKFKVVQPASGPQLELFLQSKAYKLAKVLSLSTLQRQYLAIQSIKDYKLSPILLRPSSRPEILDRFGIPKLLKEKLKANYNPSQLKAIKSCLKKQGVTLIQGPPGTGKTITLLGTIAVLLNTRHLKAKIPSSLSREQSMRLQRKTTAQQFSQPDWRDQLFYTHDFSQEDFVPMKSYPKARVTDRIIKVTVRQDDQIKPCRLLICGPSNGSVDQIIRKIVKVGLLNDQGEIYTPSLVRVGQNFDEEHQCFSLDYLASQEIKKLKASRNQQFAIKCRLLSEAKIVVSTLSASANYFMANANLCFDTVVIDQACQAIEPSSLIPLVYGSRRLIMIGDPKQLPATIFSYQAMAQGYNISLFQRMMKAGLKVDELQIQYRMHKEISWLISSTFYQGRLFDCQDLQRLLPKVAEQHPAFQRFMIFHTKNSAEQFVNKSYRNKKEAGVVKQLVKIVKQQLKLPIAVISPYSQQIIELNKQLSETAEVRTVDSFQGREKQIVIYNTVRSSKSFLKGKTIDNYHKGIGFLSDPRRLNVALSRARAYCFILGNCQKLLENPMWRGMLERSISKGCCWRIESWEAFLREKEDFRVRSSSQFK